MNQPWVPVSTQLGEHKKGADLDVGENTLLSFLLLSGCIISGLARPGLRTFPLPFSSSPAAIFNGSSNEA